ncbi:MAG: YajQ family cyclic di-GMP-binding protein [Candidatus Omnitrophica bacterium]|nr:YajQ family cyclic di-GMP-binding protein [Candidatus Omnitrophota bacterium]
MARDNSFDIESVVDLQEVDNGVNQAHKEIANRFDFKGSDTTLTFDREQKTLILESEDEFKVKSAVDILLTRLAKRGVSPKSLILDEPESAPGGRAKQKATIQQGISKEKAQEINVFIKSLKLKVQVQIQEDKMRVFGRSRDELQLVINALKEKELSIPLTFTNYR